MGSLKKSYERRGASPAGRRAPAVAGAGVLASHLLVCAGPLGLAASAGELPPSPPPPACNAVVVLRDGTAAAGLQRHAATFGHATVDLDADGDDDLVVSNHGSMPSLFINQGGVFEDRSFLLPLDGYRDRHGVSVVDLDNDGDRDLLLAGGGGGSDAVTGGMENQAMRNLLAETGVLQFESVPGAGVSFRHRRARHLLPLPGRDGRRVDLYLLAKPREGRGNLYLRNLGGGIRFGRRSVPGLDRELFSEGLDVPLDFDRDGRVDLLLLRNGRPLLLANRGGRFEAIATPFDTMGNVTAAAAGDLDGDGRPDLYLGTRAPEDPSDQVVWQGGELHFTSWGQAPRDSDSLSFRGAGDRLEVDVARLRGLGAQGAETVFIGREGFHPPRRVFAVSTAEAAGRPRLAGPGLYLWWEVASSRWRVEIHHAEEGGLEVGRLRAESIRGVATAGLERFETRPTRDRLYRNLGSGFERIDGIDLLHHKVTRSVAMVDLDHNGWLDIVVLRGAACGVENGASRVLMNCGDTGFAQRRLPNRGARIHSSSEVTFGLLDDDLRPDLFLTNGWGAAPSNRGPYRLLLNESPPAGDAVVLELVGSPSNRDAIGARVELVDDRGRLLGSRLLAYRGRAQDGHRLHFGLGEQRGPVFARILWPDGREQTTDELARNEVVRIRQDGG